MKAQNFLEKSKCGTAACATMLAVIATGGCPTAATAGSIGNYSDALTPAIWGSGIVSYRRQENEVPDFVLPRNDRTAQIVSQFSGYDFEAPIRSATESEKAIGELRSYGMLNANWDGEGSEAPERASIASAVKFLHALPENLAVPEPMLHPNGRAGLLWDAEGLYADLEFYGDGRITYFIRHSDQDKHRGVVAFHGKELPSIFKTLLA